MQAERNAERNAMSVFKSLVDDFGAQKVKMIKDRIIKLKVGYVGYMDFDNIAKLKKFTGVEAKRSDKGIIFLFTPNDLDAEYPSPPENYIENVPKGKVFETVQDFYDYVLPEEARLRAYDNTAKVKLPQSAKNLYDAIMKSFYIGDSPEGANYWQDVILENLP